jgi:hypothetical protein
MIWKLWFQFLNGRTFKNNGDLSKPLTHTNALLKKLVQLNLEQFGLNKKSGNELILSNLIKNMCGPE